MKFIVERAVLIPALERAVRAAATKSTLSALALVHLDARGGNLRVAATNLEISSSTTIGAVVLEPGFWGVDAKGLLERVRNMPDTALTFTAQTKPSQSIRITAPRTTRAYTVHAQPGDDLPAIPEPAKKVRAAYPVSVLSRLLRQCTSAMSEDDQRLHLCCVWLELGEVPCAYSTDGCRAHVAGVPARRPDTEDLNIPAGAALQLAKLCTELEVDSSIELRLSATMIHFTSGGITLGAKRVEAARVAFEQVIPNSPAATNVTLNRAALLASVKTVRVVSDRVKIEVVCEGRDRSNATMFLRSADGGDEGDSVDSVECELEGIPFAGIVTLMCQNLVDAIAAVPDQERVRIEFCGELDPAKVVASEFVAVLMPTRA